jgi:hypothetical protein
MARYFPPIRNFHSLSVKDLLEARDTYHVHLTHMDNVVATAIGRYRFRSKDEEDKTERERNAKPKTLAGSYVSDKSWPAVLVFTKEWQGLKSIDDPDEVVPGFLYMSDGRIVPTCVIQAELQDYTPQIAQPSFPSNVIGGGCPVLTEVQGRTRVGTIACLVTDGDRVYALTNHHVAGEEGTRVYTFVDGKRVPLGKSCGRHLRNEQFCRVYPNWPGENTVCTLDVGLIEIDNPYRWTAQSYLGELNRIADLHQDTISLDLIGCAMRAYAGVSREVAGEIQALFYRHKCVGGIDYVADVLIGPRRGEEALLRVAPGDSGALWLYDEETETVNGDEPTHGMRARRLRPVALQWGSHELFTGDGRKTTQYALGTFLARVFNLMDIEIVRGWNLGHTERWGQLGHYHIAATACGLVKNQQLKQLLNENMDRLAREGKIVKADYDRFCPLADVPDLVWRNQRATRARDGACHFADMDEEVKGETLMDMCYDKKNDRVFEDAVDAAVWYNFYQGVKAKLSAAARRKGTKAKPFQMGELPFRVWQIYDHLVRFAATDRDRFVCAAGILAHYVADACQPLHISRLHHGFTDKDKNVHNDIDNKIVDKHPAELWGRVAARLVAYQGEPIEGGKGAAAATIALMYRTVRTVKPEEILRVFNQKAKDRIENMWEQLHEPLAACMADGAATLAAIWDAAWKEGGGNKLPKNRLTAADESDLKRLYFEDPEFLPSLNLEQYAQDSTYAADPMPTTKTKPNAKKTPAARARTTAKKKKRATARR